MATFGIHGEMFRISRWRAKEKAKQSQQVGADVVHENEWTPARSTYPIALVQVVYVLQFSVLFIVQRPRTANMGVRDLPAIPIIVFRSNRSSQQTQ